MFFWIWILKNCIKVQEKKRKVVALCSRPRQNAWLGIFTCWEMYKKAWRACKVVVLPIKTVFCRSRCRCRRRRLCLSALVKNSVRRITEEKKGECFILSLCNAYLTLGGMAFPDRLLIACFATSILNSIKLSLKTDRGRFNTSNTLRHQKVGYRATCAWPWRIQLWL